jgi:hypothetical protein
MANVRTFATVSSAEYQRTFQAEALSLEVADLSGKSQLSKGQIFSKSYATEVLPDVYSRSADMTPADIADAAETLTVDKEYYISRYIDKHDDLQDPKNAGAKYGEVDGRAMANQVDCNVLGEVFNAANTIDDGDLGGTSGNSIALTAANIIDVIGLANEKLDLQNVPRGNRVAVVNPRFRRILTAYGIGKDTQMGDQFFSKGGAGMVDGFRLYFSTLTPTSYVLGLATNPTDGDTVTIAGQVFTFVSSIGTTAGNVLIGADADASRLNLATLINTPGTSTSTGRALTGEALKRFKLRVSAVNDATANTLTVKYLGGSNSSVSETLTAAADVWDANKSTSHIIFMHDRAISAIVQEAPSMDINKAPLRNGYFQNITSLYGTKLFLDGTKMVVNTKIKL